MCSLTLNGGSLSAVQLASWTAGSLSQSPVVSPRRPAHLCVGWLGDSPGAVWGLPAGQLTCVLTGWYTLPGQAPALALPVYLPLGVEILVKSVAYTATQYGGLRSCSTARSRTHELQHSCCDSSRFPSARVRSRRSRLSH